METSPSQFINPGCCQREREGVGKTVETSFALVAWGPPRSLTAPIHHTKKTKKDLIVDEGRIPDCPCYLIGSIWLPLLLLQKKPARCCSLNSLATKEREKEAFNSFLARPNMERNKKEAGTEEGPYSRDTRGGKKSGALIITKHFL